MVTICEEYLAEFKETFHVSSAFDHDVGFGGFIVFILADFEGFFQRVVDFLDVLIELGRLVLDDDLKM